MTFSKISRHCRQEMRVADHNQTNMNMVFPFDSLLITLKYETPHIPQKNNACKIIIGAKRKLVVINTLQNISIAQFLCENMRAIQKNSLQQQRIKIRPQQIKLRSKNTHAKYECTVTCNDWAYAVIVINTIIVIHTYYMHKRNIPRKSIRIHKNYFISCKRSNLGLSWYCLLL